jgi:Mn2+/Fe2+ NRAMP family transporter
VAWARSSGTAPKTAARPAASFTPGIIAGASAGDPTTVATLAVVGAQTGFSLAWLVVLLLLPMLATVQAVASAVGVAGGRGLQEAIAVRFGRRVAALSLVALVGVNLLTLVADLEGGAAALGLLTGLDWRWMVLPLTVVVGAALSTGNQRALRRGLSAVVLLFLAYVPAAILAHPRWSSVLLHSVVPSFHPDGRTLTAVLALMGTTLTGYVYFWQTNQEREDLGTRNRRFAQLDAAGGMAAACAVFWFILVDSGTTLGGRGRAVQTAGDAAQALRPVAGSRSGSLFAIGLLASAVLAIAVIAMTTGHAVAETLGRQQGTATRRRRGLRVVVWGALVIAALGTMGGLPPIGILVGASIVGGLVTPFTMVLLLLVARDPRTMRGAPIGPRLSVAAATAIALMTAAGIAYIAVSLAG